MQNSLLAHIASNFISEYENVANSSIAYLLNKYTAARIALMQLIKVENVPLHYITELSTDINGRPDITGLDDDGNKAIIIEGKFWANLTENQPVNYLKEIKDKGRLVFLAPEKRIYSLKNELEKRLGRIDHRVSVSSWSSFIDSIERENNKNHNPSLASDLLQLKELCKKMDTDGLPPLSQTDLDPMNGRISYQLASLLDDCHFKLKQWEPTNFKGLQKTSSKYGFGFYFRAYEFTCKLYFSDHKWFVRNTKTPFWLIVQEEFQDSIKINNLLKINYKTSHENSVGIELKVGMDKTEAIEHIVKTTKDILSLLNEKIYVDVQSNDQQ